MRPIKGIVKDFFCNPRAFLKGLLTHCAPLITNDKCYLQSLWYLKFGKKLDLKNPKSFNEKLQWLKLYDRKPIYTTMVDKVKAKKYVADIIGEEYIIPTLGVWEKAEDIDFDSLPEKFVLKCNHDSGNGMCICNDKSKLDLTKVRIELNKGLKSSYYIYNREWPYKDVPRRIIAEEFLGNNLQDYRVYCFCGVPKLIYSYTNISMADGSKPEPSYCDIFDSNWNPVPYHQRSLPRGEIHQPIFLQKMIKLATSLSQTAPFARVDFYEINNRLYIGELTLYPGSGFAYFDPEEWDYKLGEWLQLPITK